MTIITSYYHEDITLEFFTFHLRSDAGAFIELRFPSGDPIRNLRNQALSTTLRKRIEEQKYEPLSAR